MTALIPDEDTWSAHDVVSSSTGPFNFSFQYFAKTDLEVTVDNVALPQPAWSLTPGLAVDAGGYDGGSFTLGSAVANARVVIARKTVVDRDANLSPSQLTYQNINALLNKHVYTLQELRRDIGRALLANYGTSGAVIDPDNVDAVAAIADEVAITAGIDAEILITAGLASEIAIVAGLADQIAALGNDVLKSSSYTRSVGTTYADVADAYQAWFDACYADGKTGYLDTFDDVKGTLYWRKGLRIAASPGVIRFVVDSEWVGKGTSAHKNQACLLCATANGDTTYPETTNEMFIDGLNVTMVKTGVAGPTDAIRTTGMRDSKIRNLFIDVSAAYHTTTANGNQSTGASTLDVSDIDVEVEIGATIVVNGQAFTIRDTWDEVSLSLPLADEDGAAATLSRDVSDGAVVYIGPEATPFWEYRDNRDSEIQISYVHDAPRGGAFGGEISTDAQESIYETHGITWDVFGIQRGPSLDEGLAILTSGSGSAGMGKVDVSVRGVFRTRAFGFLNNTDEPPEQFYGTAEVDADIREPMDGASGVQMKNCSGVINKANLRVAAPFTASGESIANFWGVRSTALDTDREPPKISNVNVVVSGDTTGLTPIVGVSGPAHWRDPIVECVDGAEVEWAMENVTGGSVTGGVLCDGSSGSANNVLVPMVGTIAKGLLNEVDHFDGNIEEFDSSKHSVVLSNTDAAVNLFFRAGKIGLTSTTALTRVISASACLSADAQYRLVKASGGGNPSNADALPADSFLRADIVGASGFDSAARQFIDPISELVAMQPTGSFTPTPYYGTTDATTFGTPMAGTFAARYWVLGRLVLVEYTVTLTAKGTGTGTFGLSTPPGYDPATFNFGIGGMTSCANLVALTQLPISRMYSSAPKMTRFAQLSGTTGVGAITDANLSNTSTFAAYVLYNRA